MARLNTLDEVTFDVALQPLYVRMGDREVLARDSQAVVQSSSGRVLGVVGRAYRLVSHAEALSLAYECVHAAFPETKPGEWHVASVDAPSTGSSCYIDLAHNSAALDFSGLAAGDRPDVYGPFVRVTNSYNRTRALCFDIGYSRKVRKNGLILRTSSISFKMSHQQREIREAVRFEIAHEKLTKQRQDFQAFLGRLKDCSMTAGVMASLASEVLGFRAPAADVPATDARHVAWDALQDHVSAFSRRYEQELGPNAYAALNVVTELASRPPDNPLVRRDRHALQRRAGEWISDFSSKCAVQEFEVGQYLASLRRRAAVSGSAVFAAAPRR